MIISILLAILSVLIVISLITVDHFKPINLLNIKYNAEDVKIPFKLQKMSPKKLSIKEEINSRLDSQPLAWQNQMYSIPNYPYVGPQSLCIDNNQCNITSECNKDVFDRSLGIGLCTIKDPNTTVFGIKY